jgi:hypothetical protein
MRDLATYQTNYSQETNLRPQMLKYYKYVNEIRQKLDRISSGNNTDNWLDPKLSSNLCSNLEQLRNEDNTAWYLKD